MVVVASQPQGVYDLAFTLTVHAPVARVRAALTDYDHLSRVSPDILASHGRLTTQGERVSLTARVCVWFLCKTLHKTEWVRVNPRGDIVTEAIAADSDVRFQTERWTFAATDPHTTVVRYQSRFQPKFAVPPLIGPFLMRRALTTSLDETARRLARLR